MSAIEYSDLLFEISQRLEELNVLDRLLFMCRGMLASGSQDNIQDVLSLFKELEEQNNLGTDRLEVMKVILKRFKEWSFFGKVKEFESKRKRYNGLLEQIIRVLDELNDVERLIAMCRGKISEESEGHILDVRSLFRELENQNNLGYDRLDILKGILIETEKNDLLKEVEEFEERRNQEDELKRKEDEFERRKAQAVAVASSVGNKLIGVLKMKTVCKVVAGGFAVVSTMEVLSRWTTFDQLVTAVNSCVLPAGTSLVNLTDGCVCLTVQAETLSALTTLWNLYQDGTLERRLYDFFVTDEVKERAGGETVEVNVTIEEEEYDKAFRELINEAQETASIGIEERIRRNSDSAMFFKPKEELPMLKIKHAETELKFVKQRITVIERKIEQWSPEILEARSPENWKALEAGEMDERTDEQEISQRHKAKSMDPEKFAFVQKYLEDVQDTRSMTTEASDSGLATHTAVSDLGTEEINEINKRCLKDLSGDVIEELTRRLRADRTAMEKFYQFFGLKMRDQSLMEEKVSVTHIKELFPDTTVNMLKECFEALQLYDLVELLEKVRPRSLCPALSPEQIEKLRRTDDRPTKYHSNVAVLVVNHSVKGDIVKRDQAEKIEAFFKHLNSLNKVALISSASSEEISVLLRELKEKKQKEKHLQQEEKRIRLETERPRRWARLEMEIEKERLRLRHVTEEIAKLREQTKRNIEKLKEADKETEKALSTAMDEWIHNQDNFTCVAVFVISDDELYSKVMLEKLVVEKLALIPDHAKLVVSPSEWKSIRKVPETLHVVYSVLEVLPVFSRMIEIFNKRWQTLDLLSMMQELLRICPSKRRMFFGAVNPTISIKDSLSTVTAFQKKEEKDSL